VSLSDEKQLGFVLCVAGPSGSGKTSLCDKLAAELPFARRSISVTTRPPRQGESDGSHYIFVDPEAFKEMERQDRFLETAMVFGHWYGTPLEPVESALAEGLVMVMDIDTVGAGSVKSKLGERGVRVFVMPPSLEELERRLKGRKQNHASDLERRLQEAQREMEEGSHYEYVIENKRFDEAYQELQRIVEEVRSQLRLRAKKA